MLWLQHCVFRTYRGSRIFPFLLLLYSQGVLYLPFVKIAINPRLVRLLFIGGNEVFRILLGWGIFVTTLYFPIVVPRYHLKPLLGFILQIIWMNYQGPGGKLKLVRCPNIDCGASMCLTSLFDCQKALMINWKPHLKTLIWNPSEEKKEKFSCTKIFESYRKHRLNDCDV